MMASLLGQTMIGEDLLPDEVYRGICAIIHKHSHINLGANKHSFLASRLQRRKSHLRLKSWREYYQYLRQSDEGFELDILIDLVATNHTHFFREGQQLERLSQEILPLLMRNNNDPFAQLRVWSAACSTGEEAYSLAIIISEFFKKNKRLGADWKIIASDISRKALKSAEDAIYSESSLNLPDQEWLHSYFRRGSNAYEGKCRPKRSITEKVFLKRINLFQPVYPIPQKCHIIVCRNALIYFNRSSQELLASRLYEQLEPGGVLLIGYSDNLTSIEHQFESMGGGFYRKKVDQC